MNTFYKQLAGQRGLTIKDLSTPDLKKEFQEELGQARTELLENGYPLGAYIQCWMAKGHPHCLYIYERKQFT